MTEPQLPEGALTDDEFRELGRTMGTVVHRIMRLRADAEQGTLTVLSLLTKCGPARASDLARDLTLDLSTVSRHVQSLEKSGFVEKIADPTDRRAMTLHVTPDGKDFIEQLWQRRIVHMREGLDHWDPEDLRTLTRLLARYSDDFAAITARTNEDARTQHQTDHRQHGKHERHDQHQHQATDDTTEDRHQIDER